MAERNESMQVRADELEPGDVVFYPDRRSGHGPYVVSGTYVNDEDETVDLWYDDGEASRHVATVRRWAVFDINRWVTFELRPKH